MADFSIISDTSTVVLKMIRDNLCPELIQSPEAVSLAAPNDKNGDFQLGLYLYDMQELNEFRVSGKTRSASGVSAYPDKAFTLSYMLFINSHAQISSGAETQQRIFGKSIQAIMDNPILNLASAQPYTENEGDDVSVSITNPNYEEKNRIWSSFTMPYQLSIYFTVAPVVISSKAEQRFTRVVSAKFASEQVQPKDE